MLTLNWEEWGASIVSEDHKYFLKYTSFFSMLVYRITFGTKPGHIEPKCFLRVTQNWASQWGSLDRPTLLCIPVLTTVKPPFLHRFIPEDSSIDAGWWHNVARVLEWSFWCERLKVQTVLWLLHRCLFALPFFSLTYCHWVLSLALQRPINLGALGRM